jgi:hypothetical protein
LLTDEQWRARRGLPPRRHALPDPFLDEDGFPIPLRGIRSEVAARGGRIEPTPDSNGGSHVLHDWRIVHPERPAIGMWFFDMGLVSLSVDMYRDSIDIQSEGMDTPYEHAPDSAPDRTELEAFLLAVIREGTWGAWEGRNAETYPRWPEPEVDQDQG